MEYCEYFSYPNASHICESFGPSHCVLGQAANVAGHLVSAGAGGIKRREFVAGRSS